MKLQTCLSGAVVAVVIFACAVLPAPFAVGGYENHKKMGIPEDLDPIHETYLPVMIGNDFKP